MPIYEYVCDACGARFELLVASAKPKAACPQCGGRKASRQFSTFAAHQGASRSAPECPSGACPSARTCTSGVCPMKA